VPAGTLAGTASELKGVNSRGKENNGEKRPAKLGWGGRGKV